MTRPKTEFVFVHVPKTAGTSFHRLLGEVFGKRNVSLPFRVSDIRAPEARQLASSQVISGHISWLDIATHFRDRQLFTILRDPVDRCLSVYGFFRQLKSVPLIPLEQLRGENRADEAISLARQLDPEDFFRSDHPHILQNLRNRMTWQLGHHAMIGLRGGVSDADVLARAEANLRRLFFVGFFEDLDRDIGRFRTALGVPPGPALPRLMRTSSPLRMNDLSPTARAAVQNHTQLDRRLYDFARNEFRRPLRVA